VKRDDLITLGPPPAGPVPTREALAIEFGDWCTRHGVMQTNDDLALLCKLLDRRQRWWLTNFTARWDWATEDAARHPSALCTPLELAGAFMTVVREHSGRDEFARLLAADLQLGDYLDVGSVMATAFSRVHRVPVDGPSNAAAERLKLLALDIVYLHMIPAREA